LRKVRSQRKGFSVLYQYRQGIGGGIENPGLYCYQDKYFRRDDRQGTYRGIEGNFPNAARLVVIDQGKI
jgi:hypothetical protein